MGSLGLGNGSLRMDDVYLSGSTPDGPAVVAHLSVIVDTEGITFLGPEPGERRTVGWERTSPLEFGPPAELPGGEAVTSLEFVVDGRPLRLLVPTKKDPDQASDLVAAVAVPVASSTVVESPAPVAVPVASSTVVESPAPVAVPVIESPVVDLPPPVAVPVAEIPVIESPAPVAVPVIESPVVDLPPPVAVPVAESPVVEIPVVEIPVVEIPPPVAVPAPVAVPVVESPSPVEIVVTEEAAVADRFAEAPADAPAETIETSPDSPVVAPVFEDWLPEDDDMARPQPRVWYQYTPRRPRRRFSEKTPSPERLVKLVVFTVLIGLLPIAGGLRYFRSYVPSGRITGVALSDSAIAARVGIQPGDLPGWSTDAPRMGNAFAAGATTNGAGALRTAEQASTVMARCLHVPVSSVAGAFGMGSAISQINAEVTSPSYLDPAGNGGAVSSVVDMVKTPQVQQADSSVFDDPALFATCYQPFVQAMLPYAPGFGSTGFATATVQPIVVPVPEGPGAVQVAAFQIARIANQDGQAKTVVTTATAVFDGRVQATLGTVTNFVFSLDAQNELVRDLETRVLGVSEL